MRADAARTTSDFQHHSPGPRRGLILLVVLVMITLLALLAASYGYTVNAQMRSIVASQYLYQARKAAESGLQRAIVMLRGHREKYDVDGWFNNEPAFRGMQMISIEEKEEQQERSLATTYDPNAPPMWRCSLLAPNSDDPRTVRYGITDECSKLDLNRATPQQLRRFFTSIIPPDTERGVNINVLVDSLLDWREAGFKPRPNGAKDEYYMQLKPPYHCKAGQFTTVEELLYVRGFTGWVVFGEDYNRNGMLDPNEDDGDERFPPDNADGRLFRGVAPFMTVWSRGFHISNDNRQKINLNLTDLQKLQDQLEEDFDGDIVNYVMAVRRAGKAFNSVMNLFPAPPPEARRPGAGASGQAASTTQPSEEENISGEEDENAEGENEELSDLEQSTGQNGDGARPAQVKPEFVNLTGDAPPGELDDLPLMLDRLTVYSTPAHAGLINVSTAPPEVLLALTQLTPAEVESIVTARREASSEEKSTPAWLLTRGAISEVKFRRILKDITTRANTYSIDAVGYADHLGATARMYTVIEMRGPIPQILYQRDLSGVGPAFTLYGDERRELNDTGS